MGEALCWASEDSARNYRPSALEWPRGQANPVMFSTLNLRAALIALGATLLLVGAILLGSRNLGNFDPALVAYLFGTIFACFGVVYRYSVWLQRPPTWR